jgi:hypothetical protein
MMTGVSIIRGAPVRYDVVIRIIIDKCLNSSPGCCILSVIPTYKLDIDNAVY